MFPFVFIICLSREQFRKKPIVKKKKKKKKKV